MPPTIIICPCMDARSWTVLHHPVADLQPTFLTCRKRGRKTEKGVDIHSIVTVKADSHYLQLYPI